MHPERFRQIDKLYNNAREGTPEERAQVLAEADPELRREVELLLSQPSRGDFLDPSAIRNEVAQLGNSTVTVLVAGVCLGPYRVESKLGEGGMGEVFLAVDTRLGRKVAIKISNRRYDERFEREARAISSLNHPHICTLYDVGPNYLVMELVEGETLAARLKKGKLPISETLRYGRQIAAALTAAHSNGITHRDLKPGNIMVTKSGIKVLDFGLAKSAQDTTVTATNAIIGTLAYMSPEQLQGNECDARTDIYALGLVVSEMLTGKRVSTGQAPDLAGVARGIAHVVERCLAPERDGRWQSARDFELELEWASDAEPLASPEGKKSWFRIAMVAAVAGAMVGAGALWVIHRINAAPSVQASVRFRMPVPADIRLATGETFSLSPNGKTLAYMASQSDSGVRLWAQSLDALEPRVLPGTEITGGNAPSFWSPDSKLVAFDSGGKLKTTDLIGSPPQTICGVSGLMLGGSWSKAGVIIFGRDSGGISRVPQGGGEAVPVTRVESSRGERNHVFPTFLPDGHHFLYVRTSTTPENSGIYVGSIDAKPAEQELKQLLPTSFAVRFVPSPW